MMQTVSVIGEDLIHRILLQISMQPLAFGTQLFDQGGSLFKQGPE
jgi:hypothetical protein